MKCDDFYHLEYLDYYLHPDCYTQNISADMSFDLLQVFHALSSEPIVLLDNPD